MKSTIGLSLLCCATVFGQQVAQISGTVTDQSGAVVPGVQLTVTQTETGLKRAVASDSKGLYVIPDLPLGPYTLEATKMGFQTFERMGIVLQVGTNPEIPVSLRLGELSDKVLVEATASELETRTAGVGTTIVDTQKIVDLPLNGRQATDLIPLNGFAVTTSNSQPTYTMNTGPSIAVAGGMSWSVQYNLDGAPHVDTFVGTSMPLPFPDSLQEFRLSTGAQEASSGGHSGASVDAVTRSGTNAFHGDLFEFFRNSDLNARDFFAAGSDGLKRNQFGGVLGGRIIRDKLFFFLGYQGTTIRQNLVNGSAYVPTAAELKGDFSQFIAAGCPGAAGVAVSPAVLSHFSGPFALSPAALKIAAYLPQTTNPCGHVLYGTPVHQNQLQAPLRIDYQLSPKHNLFARYLITRIDTELPYDITHNVLATNQVGQDDQAQALALGETWLINSTTVNSVHFSGTRVGARTPAAVPFTPQNVGMNFYSYYGFVPILMAGVGFNTDFPANFAAGSDTITNFGFNDDLTLVRGSHQFAFGGGITRSLLNAQSYAFSQGLFIFAGIFGSPLIDFLTGNVVNLHQSNPNPDNVTQNLVGMYASDNWKVTRRLSISYGLRWNPFLPMSFRNGDTYNFSLSNFYANVRSTVVPTAPPGLLYVGDQGVNGKSGMNNQLGHVEPRIGIAWDPTGAGKTVIRAGAGIAYDTIRMDIHENTSSVSPFRLTVIQNFAGPGSLSLDNPYANNPGGNPFPYSYNSRNPVFPSQYLYQGFLPVDPNLKTPAQYTWNFGIQHQASSRLFLSATYVGSAIAHLWDNVDLNPAIWLPGKPVIASPASAAQFGQCAGLQANCGGSAENFRRLLEITNPTAPNVNDYGSITSLDSGGTQHYDGLLSNARWRATDNVDVSANWTWSHCIGLPATNISNLGAVYPHQPYQNNGPQNRHLDMGDCNGNSEDIRHIVNLIIQARTPRFARAWARRIASNWSFSTIYTFRTGAPITASLNSSLDNALNGFASAGNNPVPQRPDQVLPNVYAPNQGQSCSPAPCVSYLNPAAVATPAIGTYGNMGVGTLRGPDFWEWDQAVTREFPLREGVRLQFRAEAFNVTNSVRLGLPNATLSGTYGQITGDQPTTGAGTGISTGTGGRIMQFAFKVMF
ncbi:MAG: carboxypeptidase-like regulatory domain-containing protein [Acidobacteriia bacterium]|nr:carboxypeptidase-like regulatory domain-containing protein [Terriglobia bacterium]